MPDVLIRDIDPATLARIEAAAARAGISRNALLKELLASYAHGQEVGGLTGEQVAGFGESVRDLLDDDFRATAWQR
ncbi:MAG TPA: ribbon-helix-helix protein, CopG family [Nitriliruptorales bacterium]